MELCEKCGAVATVFKTTISPLGSETGALCESCAGPVNCHASIDAKLLEFVNRVDPSFARFANGASLTDAQRLALRDLLELPDDEEG